jgi:hypothetical protein
MNVFQLSYDTRLQSWYQLRNQISDLDTQQKCIMVDKWWQNAPLVNHYLHPIDIDNWPNPWELLVENNFCTIARALGMCYTLLLIGINDIEMVEAKDDNNEDVVLVLVDNAKYVLNYWPDTVISNKLKDFKVINSIDLNKIKTKIGTL